MISSDAKMLHTYHGPSVHEKVCDFFVNQGKKPSSWLVWLYQPCHRQGYVQQSEFVVFEDSDGDLNPLKTKNSQMNPPPNLCLDTPTTVI